ncbi:CPBP family intramembrane glutamic endopeptidase [Leucobacter denitrificans]|uniref:CPBP family intramembrane metalloprotease n=1 Tax=Leucobacter denitrificans TaxID=683042 RepID=A0A7G9S6Y2_9MICO|nr:CPBP family intramembrane glutamic endopeptidase [Leucobacter denitrificans]QNN63607.1 CPBP family intramembrane metalloprotease [Leucobacter denitrificans]
MSKTLPVDPKSPKRVPWGSVFVYIAISFGLAWLVTLPLWLQDPGDATSISAQLLAQALLVAMMFTPAIATLIVVFVCKRPRTERARFLGLWPLRPVKRVLLFLGIGLLAPIVLVALSVAVAILCGWLTPDFENFSGFAASLGGVEIGMSVQTLVVVQLVLIPFGAILNMIPAFGEELGWRGWLLPSLMPLGTWPALIISGLIWGLWHSPIIMLGHNFGLTDWRGVALMAVGCIVWGVFFGWLRLRSASVWPAVIAHGSLNAAAGTFAIIAAADSPLSLALVNPLGVAGWIAVAVGIVALALTRQFGKVPELAPTKPHSISA